MVTLGMTSVLAEEGPLPIGSDVGVNTSVIAPVAKLRSRMLTIGCTWYEVLTCLMTAPTGKSSVA